jgi:predicted ester cyclase
MVADGEKVAVRYTGQGTQQGPIWGIPPTGKRMCYTGILIWRFVNGQIAEHWAEPDRLGILQQLGVLDVPGEGSR